MRCTRQRRTDSFALLLPANTGNAAVFVRACGGARAFFAPHARCWEERGQQMWHEGNFFFSSGAGKCHCVRSMWHLRCASCAMRTSCHTTNHRPSNMHISALHMRLSKRRDLTFESDRGMHDALHTPAVSMRSSAQRQGPVLTLRDDALHGDGVSARACARLYAQATHV
jgi:hypothetical protein